MTEYLYKRPIRTFKQGLVMNNNKLPETGFLRLPQIIGNSKSNPPIPPIIPVCRSTWWEGVRTGKFPKSIKLSERITVWKVEDIRNLIENQFTIEGGC
jgi:hypothetical protein